MADEKELLAGLRRGLPPQLRKAIGDVPGVARIEHVCRDCGYHWTGDGPRSQFCPECESANTTRTHGRSHEPVGDVPDPEDAMTYDGLKASVGRITREMIDLSKMMQCHVSISDALRRQTRLVTGYLADVCNHHDIDIPEDDDGMV